MSNYLAPYELSVWKTKIDGGAVKEEKDGVIGSSEWGDSGNYNQAFDIQLTEKTNGETLFSFKMYYKYIDPRTGNKVENPYLQKLENETKLKLHYDNKWYDLVVKSIQKDSSSKIATINAISEHINDLAKKGFNLVLDDSLMNNMGTADELAEKVLEGTDWVVGESDVITQEIEETLVEATLGSAVTAYLVTYSETAGYEVKDPSEISGPIYVYSSCWDSQPDLFQFVKNPSLQDGVITNATNYVVKNPKYDPKTGKLVNLINSGDTSIKQSSTYRYKRPVFSQKSFLHPVLNRYVKEYSMDGKIKYGYTTTEFVAPILVQNLSTNNVYSSTDGWQGIKTDEDSEDRAACEILPHRVSGSHCYPMIRDIKEGELSSSYTPGLHIKFPNAHSKIINTGFSDNSALVGAISSGDYYVCKWKINSIKRDETDTTESYELGTAVGLKVEVLLCENWPYNTQTDNYNFEGAKRILEFQIANVAKWQICPVLSPTSFSEEKVKNSKIFIVLSCDSQDEDKEYLIQDFQIYKYYPNPDGKKITTDNYYTSDVKNLNLVEPIHPFSDKQNSGSETNTKIEARTITTYHYFDKADNEKVSRAEEISYEYKDTTNSTEYEKKYDFTGAAIRAISVKESNYFNGIQSIAETFQCWPVFDIEHYSNGVVKNKKVYFKKNIGEDNYAGIRYGVNLKGVSRSLDSKDIVTKLIVKNNSNEFADSGFCSINKAPSNPSGENFLYNFQYYLDTKKLDASTYLDYFYYKCPSVKSLSLDSEIASCFSNDDEGVGFNKEWNDILQKSTLAYNEAGYYDIVKSLNKQIIKYNNLIIEFSSALAEAAAQVTLNQTGLDVAKQDYEKTSNFFFRLAGFSHLNPYKNSDDSDVPDAIKKERQKKMTESDTLVRYITQLIEYQSQIDSFSTALPKAENAKKYYEGLKRKYESFVKAFSVVKKHYNQKIEKAFSAYILEGTWIDEKYIDSELYFIDSLSVLYNSCMPQVSYTINALTLQGLPGYEGFAFKLGDRTYVEDPEFFGVDGKGFPRKEPVVITERVRFLNSPEKDTIKVQNYKTQFQDLFQQITATVQNVQFSEGSYKKAAGLAEADDSRRLAFLQGAINDAEAVLKNSGEQSCVWDSSGITVTDLTKPSEQLRMVGGAIMLRTKGANGENRWATAITSKGIAADLITTGQLNTSVLQIMNGNEPTFRWDSYGLTAYGFKISESGLIADIQTEKGVRFDRLGIYGFHFSPYDESGRNTDGSLWHPKSVEPQLTDEQGNPIYDPNCLEENASFYLTWDGLKILTSNCKYNARTYEVNGDEIIKHDDEVAGPFSYVKLGRAGKFIYNDWDESGLPYWDAESADKKERFVKVLAIGTAESFEGNENFVVYSNGTVVANNIRLVGSIEWSAAASPSKDIFITKEYYEGGHNDSIKPKFTSFAQVPQTSENGGWHIQYDFDNDYYYSHTDDGGKTWSDAAPVRGKTVIDIKQSYYVSETWLTQNELEKSDIEWNDNFENFQNARGVYLYTRTENICLDGSSFVTYSTTYVGKDGKNFDRIEEYYIALPDGILDSEIEITPVETEDGIVYKSFIEDNEYIWKKQVSETEFGTDFPNLWNFEIVFTDGGEATSTTPQLMGHYGKEGVAGRSIKNIKSFYAIGNDPKKPPTEDEDEVPSFVKNDNGEYVFDIQKDPYTWQEDPDKLEPENGQCVWEANFLEFDSTKEGEDPYLYFGVSIMLVIPHETLRIVLSNDSAVVVTDEWGAHGKFGEHTKTTIQVFYGSTNVTNEWEISIVDSNQTFISELSSNEDRSRYVLAVNNYAEEQGVDSGAIKIRATKDGWAVLETDFVISKLKQGKTGEDGVAYWIESEHNTLPQHSNGICKYPSITFSTLKSSGESVQKYDSNVKIFVDEVEKYSYTVGGNSELPNKEESDSIVFTTDKEGNYTVTFYGQIISSGVKCELYLDSKFEHRVDTQTAEVIKDGNNGVNTAIVYLYKNIEEKTNIKPIELPSGDIKYTFKDHTVSVTEGGNLEGWSQDIPQSEAGYVKYVIYAIAASDGESDTIPGGEWSDPVIYTKDGQDGYTQQMVALYQRSSSQPKQPGDKEVQYTITTGALGGTYGNWSTQIPATNGHPCYVTYALALTQTPNSPIELQNWTDPVIFVQDGKSAKDLNLHASSYFFKKDGDEAIKFTAEANNIDTANIAWYVKAADNDWKFISSKNMLDASWTKADLNSFVGNKPDTNYDSFEIKVECDKYSDIVSIGTLQDGENALSFALSNPTMTFNESQPDAQEVTNVIGYNGQTPLNGGFTVSLSTAVTSLYDDIVSIVGSTIYITNPQRNVTIPFDVTYNSEIITLPVNCVINPNPYKLTLDEDFCSVPASNDGEIIEGFEYPELTLAGYVGTTQITIKHVGRSKPDDSAWYPCVVYQCAGIYQSTIDLPYTTTDGFVKFIPDALSADRGTVKFTLYGQNKEWLDEVMFEAIKNKQGETGDDAVYEYAACSPQNIVIDKNNTLSTENIEIFLKRVVGQNAAETVKDERYGIFRNAKGNPVLLPNITGEAGQLGSSTMGWKLPTSNIYEAFDGSYPSQITLEFYSSYNSTSYQYSGLIDKITIDFIRDGTDGKPGDPGKGISNVTNYYLATSTSSGVTTDTDGWTTDVQSVSSSNKYLWNYEEITYTDGTPKTTDPCIIGAYGDTGSAGKGIQRITEYYQVSNSNTTAPTTGWSTTPPTTDSTNKYLWNYEVITYTDNTYKITSKRIIGTHGDSGSSSETVVAYYRTSEGEFPTLLTGAPKSDNFDKIWTDNALASIPSEDCKWVFKCNGFKQISGDGNTISYSWEEPKLYAIEDKSTEYVEQYATYLSLTQKGSDKDFMDYDKNGNLYIKASVLSVGTVNDQVFFASDVSKKVTIGGFTVNKYGLIGKYLNSNKNTRYTGIRIDSGSQANVAFFAGATTENGANAVFKVTNGGSLTATAGKIGTWTIGTVPKAYINTAASTSDSAFTNALYSTTFDSTDNSGKSGYTTILRASTASTDWAIVNIKKETDDNSYTEVFGIKHDGTLLARKGQFLAGCELGPTLKVGQTTDGLWTILGNQEAINEWNVNGINFKPSNDRFGQGLCLTSSGDHASLVMTSSHSYVGLNSGGLTFKAVTGSNNNVYTGSITYSQYLDGMHLNIDCEGINVISFKKDGFMSEKKTHGSKNTYQIEYLPKQITFYCGYQTSNAEDKAGQFVVYATESSKYVRMNGLFQNTQGATVAQSDQKLKKDIKSLENRYDILFDNLIPRSYKWIDGTSGRTHSGYIVQEILEALKIAKLTTTDFGAVVAFGPQDKEETEWGLRYEEFISLNTWQIQKLKPRMTAAEKEIASLKLEVQQLREELAALKQ